MRLPFACLLLIILLSMTADAFSDWDEPTFEEKPWTRWWWHGSAVDEANLTRELELFAAAGFGGVEITPIYGVKGEEAREVDYLSERWLELYRHACREARRLGLGVDIVPGTGWRMGDPWVPEDERAVELELERGQGGYEAKAVLSGEKVKRPAPGGGGFTIDMLDREAVSNYLERFNERFYATVHSELTRAQFHDSWEYETDWSRGMLEEFERRRGYRLDDYLAALVTGEDQLDTEQARRVRYDYRLTVEEMLLENFSATFKELANRRGALFRNQGHGSIANLLDVYAMADIPETEIFREEVDPLIQKFASSAGHVVGRRLISAESFTWLSEHWQSDLGKLKRYADHLFLCGINHIFYHGTAYSPDDAAWPGWVFYASSQINDRNPIWRDLPALNAYIARCQSILQTGQPDSDVLLYWPIHDIYMERGGRTVKFAISGDRWTAGPSLHRAGRELWEAGYLFDYVSDRQLAEARVERGEIRLPGGSYKAVVLPELRYLPSETAQALERLARGGARVVYAGEKREWDAPGLSRLEERRSKLAAALAGLRGSSGFRQADRDAAVEALASLGVKPDGAQRPEAGVRAVRRRLPDGSALYFLVNRSGVRFDGWIGEDWPEGGIRLMDPWTGRAGVAEIESGKGARVKLEPGRSLVIAVGEEPGWQGAPWLHLNAGVGRPVELKGPWQVRFVVGGPALPEAFEMKELGSLLERDDPGIERFGGTIRYETEFRLTVQPQGAVARIRLGRVESSARVWLNGREVGVSVLEPHFVDAPKEWLRQGRNELAIEVTTLAANRIRDLDRHGIEWRIFEDINFVNIDYRPFDASGWPLREIGLLGPVRVEVADVESESR